MRWTKAQQETIEIRDKNILVSAAAGSGKTAVLIERIKQLIINDKVDIDRFLITTFTNAAAAEMKERLEKAIRAQMKEKDADRVFLKKQLNLMPTASISTFHTFALDIMRRYFYLTDLEPGFKIGDEVQISIMRNEAIDKLFEQKFEEDYENFKAFLSKYSSDRNENRIKENIISIYNEMRSVPDYLRWAEMQAELLNSDKPVEAIGLMGFIKTETAKELKAALRYYAKAALLLKEKGMQTLTEKASADCKKLSWITNRAKKTEHLYGEVLEFLQKPGFNQMRATKDEKEKFDIIKDQVSALRKQGKGILDNLIKRYFSRSFEEYEAELKLTSNDTKYLIQLIKEFEIIFKESKREKNIVDFDDVMHYAIDILKDDMAAAEYRDKFRFIFIDEFQDSNMLQETIVQRIAREDNLFMVGDVKQSIYKFRLAEPEIFKRKYALYKQLSEAKSTKIDLNNNFRSKSKIADTVNAVFEDVMDGYDDDAKLYCGVDKAYPGYDTSLHIINSDGGNQIPDRVHPEIELIKELIEENLGQPIYDVKAGKTRLIEYGDIVVLSRSKSSIGDIERYLNNEGIPAYGENTGGYFETVEVQVFINLLKIIDNTRQDIPLISAMRCPVFGFNARELAEIRIAYREGSFYNAVKKYESEGENETLKDKIAHMMQQLSFWKEIKQTITLGELIRRLLYETGYYDYCSGLPVGHQRVSNLRMLVERAEAFEESNYTGLYGFLSYVEAMNKNSISIGEAKTTGNGKNVVNIMTVHKSKGLEFPVVILMGAGRTIKFRGVGSPAAMHKDLGLSLPFVNKEEKWHRKTLLQRAIEGKKSREELEEEVRILYVALTRSMDKLIVTGTVKDAEKLGDTAGGHKSFLEMMYKPLKKTGQNIIIYEGSDEYSMTIDTSHIEARARITELFERAETETDEKTADEVSKKLSFIYPYSQQENVKSKYSVTELNKGKKNEELDIPLKVPEFAREKHRLNAAEIGTVMHLMMEKLDFGKAFSKGNVYVEQVADKLLADGTIGPDERKVIKTDNISGFFGNDIGKRAALSDRLYKEKEFILLKKVDGVDAIVQGIIDCYFEEDDGIVLIDYKNTYMGNGVSEADIAARYRSQIELYIEAIEAAADKKVKEAYLYLFNLQKFIKTI